MCLGRDTHFRGTASPIVISWSADLNVSEVNKFSVPNSSASPHSPQADAGGLSSCRGKVEKLVFRRCDCRYVSGTDGLACADIGYILLATIHTTGVRYFATFLVCAGVFPAVALTFTWVTDNQGSASKRGAGLAIFGMVGQCGPILGARLFPKSDGPWYAKGMWICAGILFGATLVAMILSLSLRMQNKKRDREFGKSDLDFVPAEVHDLGDAHPMYHYIL